jgi:branched-chain amino acid transport system ATP-binding protein
LGRIENAEELGAQPLLRVEDLSVCFDGIRALRGVSLEVRSAEIVALIGSNGSGKTTLLETVLGINFPDSGTVLFNGRSIGGTPVDRNVRAGISLVPEGRGVFSSMNVRDNLLLGAHNDRKDSAERLERVWGRFPILRERKGQVAGSLSGGERRMLAIGRSLMSSPKLIMVDELSLGLAPVVVSEIFSILVELNAEGFTILLAEQNAAKALAFAHRAYVLEMGSVVLRGPSEDLMRDPRVREAYLGA